MGYTHRKSAFDGNAAAIDTALEFLRISNNDTDNTDVLRRFLQSVQLSRKRLGEHEDFKRKSTATTHSF